MQRKGHKYLIIVYIIYFFSPLVNLLTGLTVRYNLTSITVGLIMRIVWLLIMMFYIVFVSKSKYKKISLIYLIFLSGFGLLFLVTRNNFTSISVIYNECNYLFKFMFFPILFFGMLNLIDEFGYDKKKWIKIFLVSFVFYLIFIIIPILTKTSFNSYVKEETGLVGWFYAANEVGVILLLTYPVIFSLLKKHKLIYMLLSVLGIFCLLALSTKVSKYGLLILLCCYFWFYTIFKKKNWVNKVFILINILIFLIFSSANGVKFYKIVENYNSGVENIFNGNTSSNGNLPLDPPSLNGSQDASLITKLLSGRNIKVLTINRVYVNDNIINKLLGTGFYNAKTSENFIVEMDFIDIFYHYGIIGFILLLFPYLYMLYLFIQSIKNHQFHFSLEFCYSVVIFLLVLGISFMAGHVIGSPAVSSFLVIVAIYVCNLLINQERKM